MSIIFHRCAKLEWMVSNRVGEIYVELLSHALGRLADTSEIRSNIEFQSTSATGMIDFSEFTIQQWSKLKDAISTIQTSLNAGEFNDFTESTRDEIDTISRCFLNGDNRGKWGQGK